MKFFTIAVALSAAFAAQAAFGSETKALKKEDGMPIAEEILLREDLSEELPAKEDKVEEQKLPSPSLLGSADPEGSPAATAKIDSAEKLAEALSESTIAVQHEPGTLQYEMATVEMLADAPASLQDANLPKEEVAKR